MFITNWYVNGEQLLQLKYDTANCFNLDIYFRKEIIMLTPKAAVKWFPRDHIEMLNIKMAKVKKCLDKIR